MVHLFDDDLTINTILASVSFCCNNRNLSIWSTYHNTSHNTKTVITVTPSLHNNDIIIIVIIVIIIIIVLQQ